MLRTIFILFYFMLLLLYTGKNAFAGVVNPNISVIGQIISNRTDDKASQYVNTPTLNLGETEIQIDSYLNPYSKGVFVFSLANEGISTEEAYLTILNGLPKGLGIKAGKYRAGFGKLNQEHPHSYPFIKPPRMLHSMLPGGEDGFNETCVQASMLLPTPAFGDWASTLSADILNGSSFHPDDTKSSAGGLARLNNSFLINTDIPTPIDAGISATQGTNNIQWGTRATVYGADFKIKIPFSNQTKLTAQGEYLYNNSDVIVDSATGSFNNTGRTGFYTFADLSFWQRYNAGIIYDQYQIPENKGLTNKTIKVFVGYALLEETTLFRLAYEQFMPERGEVVNTYSFQILFSMGPHRPHQF